MNDLQARLASTGEAARVAAPRYVPDPSIAPSRLALAAPMDDATEVHDAIAAAPPERQAVVLQRLRLIDQIAQAIRGQTRDPVERARMAQHIAQMHPEMGIDPGMLTPQSMSDANIAALHQLAIEATLKVALANIHAGRAAGGTATSAQTVNSAGAAGAGKDPAAQTPFPPASGPSHAAQGFTLLGVE